ncbi:hypothetical protein ACHWQZ_G001287 [Mnemiopsis leidyi]
MTPQIEMYLVIVLLSYITTSVLSSDPSEVFITVDEKYFKTNSVINIKSGQTLSIDCASSVIGSDSVNYKWYLSKRPYTQQVNQREEASSSKVFTVSANSTHTGYYMCLIRSEEGYAVFTPVLHVVVEYFDIETVSAKTTIEPNEKVAVLKCSQINANPAPIVTWKKDGVDVRNINLDSNVMHVTGKVVDKQYNIEENDLVILNYQDNYAGTYTCDVEATGSFFKGRTATAKSYSVKTAASFSLMNDNSSQILFIDNGGKPKVGDAITLRCGACGYPTPSYEWYDTADKKLQTSDVYEVLETSMIVKSIKATDDTAEYKCAALTANSKSVQSIRLTLSDTVPKFNKTIENSQYNIPGATVILDFGLEVRGEIHIMWNGQGLDKFILNDDSTAMANRGVLDHVNDNNVLTISNIQKNASGVFQCIVYNEAGMVSAYKTVIIRESQPAQVAHTTVSTTDITVKGNDIHSVRGANFTMQCTGSGNPTPSDISIDVPDSTSAIASSLVKVNKEGKYIGNLLIDKVTEQYAGVYKCCTHNFIKGMKETACVNISLAVEEKVSVTQHSEDTDYTLVIGTQVYGTTGYPLSASCKATGLPRPTISIKRNNDCGTVSTITKSNDIELTDSVIIQVDYANDTVCNTDSFQCCGNNTIQGTLYTDCYDWITISFVDQEKPNDVKIENTGNLASDDSSLVSLMETLMLNCSAKSFPESEFTWEYRNSESTSNTFQKLESVSFQTSVTKSKGFTYSMLSTIGTAGDLLKGTNYEFQCTAKNVFGQTSVIKSIQITSSAANQVSANVYLGVGIVLFIAALVAVFVMYIFFIISSGKKKRSDLGIMSCLVCKCCEPKQPVEYADEIYNASLYTDKSYSTAVKKVDIYPDIKHMTFDDDEFDRSNTIAFNGSSLMGVSEFDDRMFTLNTAVFKDPDIA